jgi:single-stranded DNA-binding protein
MFTVTGKGIACKDSELRFTSSGKPIAKATLVNSEEYKGNKTPHFTNVVVFGELAETFSKEVVKGALVDISGILKHPVREGSDGKKYYNTEVVILEYEVEKVFKPKTEDKPESKRRTSSKK